MLKRRTGVAHSLEQRRLMPSGCNPLCMTSADFDLNGRMDLVNCAEDAGIATKGLLRITYNRCLGYGCATPDSCVLCPTDRVKGDMHANCHDCDTNSSCAVCNPGSPVWDCNTHVACDCTSNCMVTGCCIDGDDIQQFVNVLFDPEHASRRCYCLADLNEDGYVSEADRLCFVATLLQLRRPNQRCGYAGDACGGAFEFVSGGGEGSGQQNAAAPSGGGGGSEPDARYSLLAAWDADHPRPECAILSAQARAWSRARLAYMAELGLISSSLAGDMSDFADWQAVNLQRDHPELSAAEYEELALSTFENYVGSALGGRP